MIAFLDIYVIAAIKCGIDMEFTNHRVTEEEAIRIARTYGLEEEVRMMMEDGFTPEQALYEWDIY